MEVFSVYIQILSYEYIERKTKKRRLEFPLDRFINFFFDHPVYIEILVKSFV